jgi:hypothetical protein
MNYLRKIGKYLLLVPVLFIYLSFLISIIASQLNLEFRPIDAMYFYVAVYSFAIMVVSYVVCIIRNKTFDTEKKTLWVFLIISLGYLIAPVYWYRYIYKNEKVVLPEKSSVNVKNVDSDETRPDIITKKSSKILLLFFTVLPYILGISAILLAVYTEPTNLYFIIMAIMAYISGISIMIFYIINLFRNRTIERDKRALWVVLLVFGNIITNIFYWYLHIWKHTDNSNNSPDLQNP